MTKIIMFGSGTKAINILKWHIQDMDLYEVIAIVDNNKAKQGSFIDNIPIISAENLRTIAFDKILIASTFVDEIYRQLHDDLLIKKEKIIIPQNNFFFLEARIKKKYERYYLGIENIDDNEMRICLDYLNNNPLDMYCYDFIKKYKNREVKVYKDEEADLFYIIENDKRMYFARKYNTEEKVRTYYNDISLEQDTASPHRYENSKFRINYGNVGIDVGAAEGNFSLAVIDRVSKIYLVEADDGWIEALQYTFRPYKDKVIIIKGMVSNQDTNEYITLDKVVKEISIDFIKMDIEGFEVKALEGSKRLLQSPNMKAAICVYHNENDNNVITDILKEYGMNVENTQGYLLCIGDWEMQNKNLDFRKAITIGIK